MIELTIKSAKPSFVDELMLMDEDDKHLHSQKYKNDGPNSLYQQVVKIIKIKMKKN